MAEDLQRHPEILNVSDSSLLHGFMESNLSLSNTSTLLQQLDTIDNAACGWIQFMSKVGLAGLPLGPESEGSSWAPPGRSHGWKVKKGVPEEGMAGLFKNVLKI